MKKKQDKRHSAEQIVRKLREADTMLAAGKMSDGVDVVVRQQP